MIIIAAAASAFSANERVIAIFDFKGAVRSNYDKGKKFSLLLFSKLSAYNNIKMVERQQLNKLLKERKLNRSGLVDLKYLEIAKLLNADFIITGRLFEDGDNKIINLKLTRCSDGTIFGKSFFVPKATKDYLEKASVDAAAYAVKKIKQLK